MKTLTLICFLSTLAFLSACGCGGEHTAGESAGNVDTLILTDTDIDQYTQAMKEFVRRDRSVGKGMGITTVLPFNYRTEKIYLKHGLTKEKVATIHDAIERAFGATYQQVQKNMHETRKMIERLEKAHGIKPSQVDELKKNLARAKRESEALMKDTPEENIHLVMKRHKEIEAAYN